MFNQDTYQKRAEALQKNILSGQLIIISSYTDIQYLSNFSFLVPEEREAFLLITQKSVNLAYSSFSPTNDYSFVNYYSGCYPNQLAEHLEKIVESEKISEVLIDHQTLFVSELEAIKEKLPKIKISNFDQKLVRNLRNIKSVEEVKLIKNASQITSTVMNNVRAQLETGITELEVKKLIDEEFKKLGVENLAFPTIVAFGENSALPHHQPGEKSLEYNMSVLIDIGGKIEGYCSDMTRSFWFGDKPSKKYIEIESIVKEAYQVVYKTLTDHQKSKSQKTTAKNKLKIMAKNLDNAARTLISNKGHGENFIHTTGHGLGLSIHEQPSLSWKNSNEIKTGMVITIEPGIYLEDEFGFRYENTVLVKNDGVDELTSAQK